MGGISLGLYLRHRSIRIKRENLAQYMDSGETYLRYDNYQKAAEEYGEALKLAKNLKRQEDTKEADQYKKLAEQIILSDEAMIAGEYQKAQALYLTAKDMSLAAGNVGKSYIDSQLKLTKDYIDVFDLIELGEQKEANDNLEGAIETYKEARDKAASLYYAAGKEEALEKQAAAEAKSDKAEQQKQAKKKETEESAAAEAAVQLQEEASKKELENQQKANDQQNAIELENKGNELLAEGKYENAITFYQTAQAIYTRLELTELAYGINDKIAAARAGIEAKEQAEKQAEKEQSLAREEETADAETKEYGPGVSMQ